MAIVAYHILAQLQVAYYHSRVEKVGGMRFIHLRISPRRKVVLSYCLSHRP